MNSPILSYLSSYGIDPAYIMIGLLVLILILFILYKDNLIEGIEKSVVGSSKR